MTLNQTSHTIEIADQQNADFDAAPLIAAIQMIADDHEIGQAEISVAIVDDPTIRDLNRQYLEHDYETDVISFVLDWNEDTGALLGQLIVSTGYGSNFSRRRWQHHARRIVAVRDPRNAALSRLRRQTAHCCD